MTKIVFGCGYLGRPVARHWLEDDEPVYALTRSADRANDLEEQGLRPIVGDVTQPLKLPRDATEPIVLFAVGFDRQSGKSIQEVYVDGLRNVLDALPAGTRRFIYVSSTGVYGQTEGQWVDEESPCQPLRPGGTACLAAERLLAGHPLGARAIVLRMAGLYGPGRLPKREALLGQQPLKTRPTAMLNLIHQEDAVQAVVAAARCGKPPRTYTVSDGHPVERRVFYEEMARLLGVAPPQFGDPGGSATRRDDSDKRVGNRRLLEELGVQLRYPSYREGLAAAV